jgi:uncharacterized membrane protein
MFAFNNFIEILLLQIFQPIWDNPWLFGVMIVLIIIFGALVEFIIWLIKRRKQKQQNDEVEIPEVFEE